MYFSELAVKWLELYKKGIVKDNSFLGTYSIPVKKHLIPYFGNKNVEEITPIVVQTFFRELEAVYSLEYQKKFRAALKAIFECGVENGFCQKNPITKSLRLKSTVPARKKRVYSQEEYELIWRYALQHPKGLSILLLMELGISRSELLGIECRNIDLKRLQIRLIDGTVSQKNTKTGHWETVTNGLKTEYRKRTLPISKELGIAIALAPPSKSGFLIESPKGHVYEPGNWYKRVYKVFMRDLINLHPDLPCLTPHELRHTRATIWVDKGLNLLDVAYLGGWANLKMLRQRYYHVNLEQLRQRMDV